MLVKFLYKIIVIKQELLWVAEPKLKSKQNGMVDHKSFCPLMLPLNAIRKKVLNPPGGGHC